MKLRNVALTGAAIGGLAGISQVVQHPEYLTSAEGMLVGGVRIVADAGGLAGIFILFALAFGGRDQNSN